MWIEAAEEEADRPVAEAELAAQRQLTIAIQPVEQGPRVAVEPAF